MENFYPDILVLGPGAMKGLLIIGALNYLHLKGGLKNVSKIVGCSIGSVIGLLYCCGYKPSELFSLSEKYSKFFNFIPKNLKLIDVINNKGLINPQDIKTLLDELVMDKFGFIPTLKELFELSNIELNTVHTNLDDREYNLINYKNNENMECTLAVIIGINVPFIISSINFNGKECIDGALTNPYPINIYDDGKMKILGIYIDQTYEISNYFVKFSCILLNLSIIGIRNILIEKSSEKCKHLKLLTDLNDPLTFNLTQETRKKLFMSGFIQCKKFFEK